MSPSKDLSEMTALKVDVGVMKAQMDDLKLVTDRIEKKIDGMTYATTSDLAGVIKMVEELKRETRDTYATKDSVAPYIKIIIGLVSLILVGVGGAVMQGVLK